LKKIYNKIYGKVVKKEHIKTLFNCVYILMIYTYTPLTNIELITTISLDLDKNAFYLADEIDERLILNFYNNLFVLNSQQKV